MLMKHLLIPGIVAILLAGAASGQDANRPATPNSSKAEGETRYLGFQIFTYGPDPRIPSMGEGRDPIARFPERATLRDYILDIKRRIGTVGDRRNRLAFVVGHLSFDHDDAEVVRFIEMAFGLALETDVAVGFHVDDSMFWASARTCGAIRITWRPSTGTGPRARADASTGRPEPAHSRMPRLRRCVSIAR